MPTLARSRWQRFGLNAARYAIGPLGGLVVPWLVMHQSGSQAAWGDALRVIIPLHFFIHVAAWGSRDHLLRLFAAGQEQPRVLAVQSMLTRAVVFLPLLLVVGVVADEAWTFGALWAGCTLLAASFESVFIWQKRFGSMLLMEAAGLFAQCLALVLLGPVGTGTVIASFMLGAVVKLGLIRHWSNGRPRHEPSNGVFHVSFRSHFKDAMPFMLIGLSGLLATRIDLYTANVLLSDVDLGRYQITSSLFVQFQALAALIVGPFIRDLFQLKGHSVLRYSRRLRLWALGGMLPMAVLVRSVLHFGFGFGFPWYTYAAGCLMVWPVFANAPIIYALFKRGHERSIVMAGLAAAGLSCALTYVLLPRIGTTGGLLAAAAGQWLMFVRVQTLTPRLIDATGY